MKAIKFTCAAIFSLILGIAVPAYTQEQRDEKQDPHQQQQSQPGQARPEPGHEQHQQEQKPEQLSQKQQQNNNQRKQQQAKQQQNDKEQQTQKRNDNQKAQQEKQNQKEQAQKQQNDNQRHAQQQQQNQIKQHGRQQPSNQQSKRMPDQQRIRQSAWQQHRSGNWQSDHRTWQQRGGYNGYRIPDDRFRGYFGPSHRFRIVGLPFLVVGGYPRFQYQGYWFSPVDPWPSAWGDHWYDSDDVYVNYVDNGYYLYDRRYPQQGIAITINL